MKFKEAFDKMMKGEAVKRRDWIGYWIFDHDRETIVMHCNNGRVMDIRETQDVIFTVSNMLADDWEVTGSRLPSPPMDFGDAIKAVKAGKKISRRGWNGKGQYVFLAKEIQYTAQDGQSGGIALHRDIGSQALVFCGTSGRQMGWLASQADMLAEDWHILGE